MPLIAYQRAHGDNDYPLHLAFFAELEARGLLERFDFAIDPDLDEAYADLLVARFPQLCLTTDVSAAARGRRRASRFSSTAANAVARAERQFDAAVEAPGGRIHHLYSTGNLFWAYPRARQTAVLFHSIERRALESSKLRTSLAGCDLVVARTDASAENARLAGVAPGKIASASDVVFRNDLSGRHQRDGIAAALRLPNAEPDEELRNTLIEIIETLLATGKHIDFTEIEHDMAGVQVRRGLASFEVPNGQMWHGDSFYVPFTSPREAVISCRLHTTLLALMAGTTRILQVKVEEGTSKVEEMLGDIGLPLPVTPLSKINQASVAEFLSDDSAALDPVTVDSALQTARSRTNGGFDRIEEWLDQL